MKNTRADALRVTCADRVTAPCAVGALIQSMTRFDGHLIQRRSHPALSDTAPATGCWSCTCRHIPRDVPTSNLRPQLGASLVTAASFGLILPGAPKSGARTKCPSKPRTRPRFAGSPTCRRVRQAHPTGCKRFRPRPAIRSSMLTTPDNGSQRAPTTRNRAGQGDNQRRATDPPLHPTARVRHTQRHLPDGPFQPDTPPYATTTAQFAATVRRTITTQGLSLRETARRAGISHATLINLLAGTVVPDLGTITALEHALNTSLYPTYLPP